MGTRTEGFVMTVYTTTRSPVRATLIVAIGVALLSASAAMAGDDPQPFQNSSFRRADANADGAVDISDAQTTFNFLFLGGATPTCLDAVDTNDDGALDVSDGVFTLGYLFLSGFDIPYPGPKLCDRDPTDDQFGCELFMPCVCGGIAGFPCDEGQFCDFHPGFCKATDVMGQCVPFPDACPTVYDPVCGCNDMTYPNDCERIRAGVAKAHDGPCGDSAEFRTLDRGISSGAAEQTKIIRDESSWIEFWTKHGRIFMPMPERPEVDFDTEMVIAVVRHFTSGGYSVTIQGIVHRPKEIQILYTLVEPSSGCPTTDALTQPYHFVATPRADGDPAAVETIVAMCCSMPMDARGTGSCEKLLGFAWDRTGCQPVVGCECEGDDCDRLFQSPAQCQAFYSLCPES